MRLKGAHLILPKVDRMLGAHAAVPLSPLFDTDVLRLSLTMPPTAKLRFGIEKWVLKEAYRRSLPDRIVHRPKSGMRVPVRWWFQRELKGSRATSSRRAQCAGQGCSVPSGCARSSITAPAATGYGCGC